MAGYYPAMKRLLLLSATMLLILACGSKESQKKKSAAVYGERSLGIPVPLRVSQKQCTSNFLIDPLEVDLVRRGRERAFRTDFSSGILSVFQTDFAGSYKGADQFTLLNSPEIEKQSQIFEVCDIDGEYESNTYQDAALSILTPIKSFENRHPEIVKELALPAVKIRVAPLLKQGNRFLINNAFYYSGTREITFLPQGYESEQDLDLPMGGKPFWKFPMVALHEYGHHIFIETLRSHSRDKADLPPLGMCFDNSSHDGARHTSNLNQIHIESDTSRIVNPRTTMIAINEAFADIFAYYAEPGSRGLINMGCMTKSRDVESHTFFNGDVKILHDREIRLFLSSEKSEYTGCDTMTNFQDPHIIGAVLSRAIFKVFEFQRVSDKRKLSILIDWVDQFFEKAIDETDSKNILKIAVDEFYFAVKRKMRVSSLRCMKYYSHFPGITKNSCF